MSNQPARRRADNVPLGIGLTIAAILIFGVQDAVSKYLVQDYSPFQLAMMRFWAFALFSLILVMRQGPISQAFRSKSPKTQILRGAAGGDVPPAAARLLDVAALRPLAFDALVCRRPKVGSLRGGW